MKRRPANRFRPPPGEGRGGGDRIRPFIVPALLGVAFAASAQVTPSEPFGGRPFGAPPGTQPPSAASAQSHAAAQQSAQQPQVQPQLQPPQMQQPQMQVQMQQPTPTPRQSMLPGGVPQGATPPVAPAVAPQFATPPPAPPPPPQAAVPPAPAPMAQPFGSARASAPAAPAASTAQPAVRGLPADAPKLVITGSVYSRNPAQRMLIVNGQPFREGADLGSGVVLQEVRPESAVLGFRGSSYNVLF